MIYLVIWSALLVVMVMVVECMFWIWDNINYYIQRHKEYKILKDYVENPVEMTNDRGEVFWVGYKK